MFVQGEGHTLNRVLEFVLVLLVTNVDAELHDAGFPVVRSVRSGDVVVHLPGREKHLLAQQLDDDRLHDAVLHCFVVLELLEPRVLLLAALLTQVGLLLALHRDLVAVGALLLEQSLLLDHLHDRVVVLNIVHLEPLPLCLFVLGEDVDVHFLVLLARVQVHVPLFHLRVAVVFVQKEVEFALVQPEFRQHCEHPVFHVLDEPFHALALLDADVVDLGGYVVEGVLLKFVDEVVFEVVVHQLVLAEASVVEEYFCAREDLDVFGRHDYVVFVHLEVFEERFVCKGRLDRLVDGPLLLLRGVLLVDGTVDVFEVLVHTRRSRLVVEEVARHPEQLAELQRFQQEVFRVVRGARDQKHFLLRIQIQPVVGGVVLAEGGFRQAQCAEFGFDALLRGLQDPSGHAVALH